MSDPIVLEIPSDLHEDDWEDFLRENISDFEDALDLSAGLEPNDPRVNKDEPKIKRVTILEDEVRIDYSVSWSIYFGCDDQNNSGDESHCVHAARQGNVLTFERHVDPEPRSTFEEY